MKAVFDVFVDLFGFLKSTRKIYISLLIAFLLLMGAIVVLTEGTAIMPFIYTIF